MIAMYGSTYENALMVEKTAQANRFNWRLQSCAAFVAFVVFVAIAVCQADTSLMLFLFVVAPILLVISIGSHPRGPTQLFAVAVKTAR
jgi:hypothetical protein